MLHRVNAVKNLDLNLNNIQTLEKPQNLSVLFYGFNSLRFALEQLHPEGVSFLMKKSLDKPIAATDVDLIICPREQALKHLSEDNALGYYLAVAQRIKNTPYFDRISERQKTFAFLGFNHNEIDCSLQAKPLTEQIHSSTQAFYDLHERQFVFKNKNCYQHFLHRSIYTPDLEDLVSQSMNNPILYKTLIFILKNHLKMRYIGWTLSPEDRKILSDVSDNKPFAKRLNQSLNESLVKYPFIFELKNELGEKYSSLDLLLKERDIEQMAYLRYQSSKNIQVLIEDIEWMKNQVTCPENEKKVLIERFCEEILCDRTRTDDKKIEFIRAIESFFVSENCNRWLSKRKSNSPVSKVLSTQFNHSFSEEAQLYKAKHFNLVNHRSDIPSTNPQTLADVIYMNAQVKFALSHKESSLRLSVFLFMMMPIHQLYLYTQEKYQQNYPFNMIILSMITLFLLYLAEQISQKLYEYANQQLGRDLLAIESIRQTALSLRNNSPPCRVFSLMVITLDICLELRDCESHYKELINQAIMLFNRQDHPRFNVRMIHQLVQLLDNQASLGDIIQTLCISAMKHSCKLEDIFKMDPDSPLKKEDLVETLKGQHHEYEEKIITQIKACSPINEKLMNLISQYLKSSVQLRLMGINPGKIQTLSQFVEKKYSMHKDDAAQMYELFSDPLRIFLQEKENKVSLACELNALISTAEGDEENKPLAYALKF